MYDSFFLLTYNFKREEHDNNTILLEKLEYLGIFEYCYFTRIR